MAGAWLKTRPRRLTATADHACWQRQVKEARACAREAVSVLQELQRFAAEEPGGDWAAAASSYEGAILRVRSGKASWNVFIR
jgi:hypothetical protein